MSEPKFEYITSWHYEQIVKLLLADKAFLRRLQAKLEELEIEDAHE